MVEPGAGVDPAIGAHGAPYGGAGAGRGCVGGSRPLIGGKGKSGLKSLHKVCAGPVAAKLEDDP
ncbi:hypothetical protein D3C71_1917300 [compost metagenome]